jgi:hypothetical protein
MILSGTRSMSCSGGRLTRDGGRKVGHDRRQRGPAASSSRNGFGITRTACAEQMPAPKSELSCSGDSVSRSRRGAVHWLGQQCVLPRIVMARKTKVTSPAAQQDQVIGFELSPALIAFRRTAGDANRHLNTMLVALETLKETAPVQPKGLAVPWTKPGVKKEWEDSRDFVLKGCVIARSVYARRLPHFRSGCARAR